MKRSCLLAVLLLMAATALSQKTMLVEKIGTGRKYYFKTGDRLKIRVSKLDTLLTGRLWALDDSVITVTELRPFDVRIADINSVYKQFKYPRKFSKYMFYGSAGIFVIIGINHLINNEQVFTPDMFYISGAILGAGLISFSLSEKRCKIGLHWKIKILDMEIKGR